MEEYGFNIITNFMKKIVLAVTGDVNFGAIQYSDVVKTEFNLKKRAPESVVELIDAIVYDGGYSTITGAALTEAYTSVHSGIFGGRSGAEFFPITCLIIYQPYDQRNEVSPL